MFDYELFEDNFDFRLITSNTWCIGTKCPTTPWGCDCYLLEGDDKAVMIDSGMSKLNLKAYIDELKLTDKPIIGVINTHSHFDHTGGNGWFGHAWMHPAAEKGAKTPFGANISDKPDVDAFILDYPITYVHEGDTLELGSRTLEFIEIPAHDLGSIAILDHQNRLLFSGDELETGWCNVNSMGPRLIPKMTIENHYNNMLKLKARWDEFDRICPGHHGQPVAKETLDHVITCDKMILDGVEGDPIIPKKNGGGRSNPDMRVMRYKSAHMCYNIHKIWESQVAGGGEIAE